MFGNRPPSVSASSEASANASAALRRYVRAAVDLPVHYDVDGQPETRTSRIDDLGGGGLRLETVEDLASGAGLELRFQLGETHIQARGRVVLSLFDGGRQRFLHGVAFTAIDPELQAAIVAFVAAAGG